MKYEVVVIWDDGRKDVYEYGTKEKAENIAQGYKMAFGNQIAWTGVRVKR